ncbi:signal sequence receptor subunit 1 l(1)G0320 isoform X2 [Brevipalpus obovatus]|uniref:signal sequence receptor subunit 1 l(1)G0320 isoform X2 n=1 Tax=Brevipalpus obovatus TaxID=246614 RepID=UPI003D9DB3D9
MFRAPFLLICLLLAGPRGLLCDDKASTADVVEGEDEANVEEVVSGPFEDATDEDSPFLKPSLDVEANFLFTKPVGMGLDLPAGSDVHFLVGFVNRGSKDFVLETMDASFRYAMDFSFHLQNFSAIPYNRVVKPNQEATLAYSFFISDAYSTRPYGLTVSLFYKDLEGNRFMNAVFNETVNIVEIDEGLDGETFFLYLFLIALVGLMGFAGQHFLVSMSVTRSSTNKQKFEVGTTNSGDVDYDWLPKETLQSLNKSKNQKYSPRQRSVKRGTGHADDK